MIHDVGQEDDLGVSESDKLDRSLNVVTYINLDSIQSIIFTKLESSMNQQINYAKNS